MIRNNILKVHFSSPNTDSYKRVRYFQYRISNDSELNNIKETIKKAQLEQDRMVVPQAKFSAYTREILIVQYKDINIVGGLTYGNSASYPNDESENQVQKEINNDRNQSSSINGDYDLLITELKKYFVDLDRLIEQSKKE